MSKLVKSLIVGPLLCATLVCLDVAFISLSQPIPAPAKWCMCAASLIMLVMFVGLTVSVVSK